MAALSVESERGLERPPKIIPQLFLGPVRSGLILVHTNRLNFAFSNLTGIYRHSSRIGIGTLVTMTEVDMATAASEAKPKPERL